MAPLMQLSWHYIERANAFPLIADFSKSWSSSFVRYNQGEYPGVSIIEPEPDWSGYHKLRLTIYSMNEQSRTLTLRVHDKLHNHMHSDRFNKKLSIQPGMNEFQIALSQIQHGPVDRELDLTNIAGVILFTYTPEDWRQIKVGNIYLE